MNAKSLNQPKPLTTYTHSQPVLSTVWTIQHNLGRNPAAIRLVDSVGATIIGDVVDIDLNTTQVSFTRQVAGRAFIE